MSAPLSEENLNAFITREVKLLQLYDSGRPAGHPYAFHEHVIRVAEDMFNLALAMGAPVAQADLLSRLSLVHDMGKRFLPVEIWDVEGKPDEKTRTERRRHTQLGVEHLNSSFGADNDDSIIQMMRDLAAYHHESMDGSGWVGLKGEQISTEVRMLCICDAFDGYSTWRPHFGDRDISVDGVLHRMQVEKVRQFDQDILHVFAALKREQARAASDASTSTKD